MQLSSARLKHVILSSNCTEEMWSKYNYCLNNFKPNFIRANNIMYYILYNIMYHITIIL